MPEVAISYQGTVDTGVFTNEKADIAVSVSNPLPVALYGPSGGAEQPYYTQSTTGITTNSQGTTVDMTLSPKSKFAIQVMRTAGANPFDVDLAGSLDGTNWFDIGGHSNTSGEITWFVDKPVRYMRYDVVDVGVGNTLSIILLATP